MFPMAAPQVLLSLRHPLLWGMFSAEPELIQHAILDGNRDALGELAKAYVRRFLTGR